LLPVRIVARELAPSAPQSDSWQFAVCARLLWVDMPGKRIRDYFIRQARILVEDSSKDSQGFAAYFSDRQPRDEEILGLIAVTVLLSGKYHLADRYPTPAEALAALSAADRSKICQEFRRHLQASRRQRLLV
jgi:hypothetical protein